MKSELLRAGDPSCQRLGDETAENPKPDDASDGVKFAGTFAPK